jgi:hypothetical protein
MVRKRARFGDRCRLFENWQTEMNGVLLFGWSTAVIFEVLRRTARRGD